MRIPKEYRALPERSGLRDSMLEEQLAEVRAIQPRQLGGGRLVATGMGDESLQVDARKALAQLLFLVGIRALHVDQIAEDHFEAGGGRSRGLGEHPERGVSLHHVPQLA